jgi:hypothetical protein
MSRAGTSMNNLPRFFNPTSHGQDAHATIDMLL